MTVNKKIHEESDFNNAEKAAENIIHWVLENRNQVIGIAVAIVLVVVGISSFSYMQEQKLSDAKTAFGTLFIEQQKTGSYDKDALTEIYDTNPEAELASYAAYILATVALEERRYDDAEQWFDNALTKKPSADFVLSGIYEGKGVIAETKDQKEEAVSFYNKALSAKKNNFRTNDIRMKIALVKKNSGENADAKVQCEEIIKDSTATPQLKQRAENLLLTL